MLDEWVVRICEWAGFTPDLDAFASPKNARFPRYWDKHLNAFLQTWDVLRLWVNPPFSLLPDVLAKLKSESSYGILITPVQPEAPWWEDLRALTVTYWDLPSDTSLFMLENGKTMAPLPSGYVRLLWMALFPFLQ